MLDFGKWDSGGGGGGVKQGFFAGAFADLTDLDRWTGD